MGAIAVILLLVVGLIIVAPLLLFVGQSNLKARLADLEKQIKVLERQLKQPEQPDPATSHPNPVEMDASTVVSSSVEDEDRSVAEQFSAPKISEHQETLSSAAEEAVPPQPDRATTDRVNHIEQFIDWTRENWVLAAGAISLALAGVFLVQYGAERGLLTPSARVGLALAFGVLLLVAGEVLRRRFGDETDGPTRFLPSALAGAGFVTLFAAILAARALYGLVDPGTAFAGLVFVSCLSIVFGWFYGALLSGVGIIGSILAPYLVGGDTESPWLLSFYFVLIGVVALAIDSFKRWAWLSVLALAGSAVSIWLIYITSGYPTHFLATSLLLGFGALTLPERRMRPAQNGPPVAGLLFGQTAQRFPTWLAFVAVANASNAAWIVGIDDGVADSQLALVVLAAVFVGAVYWMAKAPALSDLVLLPAVAFLGLIAAQTGGLFRAFQMPPAPEETPPWIAAQLVAMAVGASFLVARRVSSFRDTHEAVFRSLGAAVFAPIAIFLLEFLWAPATQYGATGWALMVIGAAGVMTFLSERAMRQTDGSEVRLHSAFFAGAAVALIGLALFIVLTKTALTLALALMVLVVVAIDRRFDLPLLGLFVQLGLLVISYRIVVDPGVVWMSLRTTPLSDILLGHLGTAAILVAARLLLRADRPRQGAGIEGALAIIAAAFIFILFERFFADSFGATHVRYGLLATLWLVVSLVQLRATEGADRFERGLRLTVGMLIGALAAFAAGMLFAVANPLWNSAETVFGPAFLSSLALAYLPLAGVLGFTALRMFHVPSTVRIGLGALSAGLCVWYAALSIRQFWQGAVLSKPGVTDPELYSYTMAMLVVAAALLAISFQRRSHLIRKLAMALVGLTTAKVFLVDMAGLTGLMRVLSFMGLGLALLALTWLNRVMETQWERIAPSTSET